MPPTRGPDGRFKPKQPKPRKKKTAEQKSAIAKRNKAESARVDDVALQRKRQQALFNDPRKYLTEGMSAGASREVLKQYDRVLEYNSRKAQDELADAMGGMALDLPEDEDEGPTYSPGSPVYPMSPAVSIGGVDAITQGMAQLSTAPKFPPGVKIKMKNPTSEVRQHNKDVLREQRASAGWSREPVYPGNQLPDDEYEEFRRREDELTAKKQAEFRRVDVRTGAQKMSKWEQMLARRANPDVQDYLARQPVFTDIDPSNPFAPTPQSIAFASRDAMDELTDRMEGAEIVEEYPTTGTPGDYMYELEKEREAERALREVQQFEALQYNQEERERNAVAPTFAPEPVVVKMTDEEKEEIKFKAKDLLAKKKMAKTQEEKDYYKRALADLKEGETQAQKSRKRQLMEQQERSAPTAFTPQVGGVKKYPGPANIQNGFAVVSTEVGRRDLTDDEAQHYMGGGASGRTQTYTSGEAEVNDEYQRYASRKTQSLSGLRTMGGTIKGKLTNFDDPMDVDDSAQSARELAERLDRIPVDDGFMYEDEDTDDE